jgi:hypothetical protein
VDLLLKAVLLGLAGWRIGHMLVAEEGPALVFERLRVWAGVKPGIISGFLPTLFSCIYCMSVWTTSLMYLLWLVSPEAVMLVAAWSVALMVHSVAGLKE